MRPGARHAGSSALVALIAAVRSGGRGTWDARRSRAMSREFRQLVVPVAEEKISVGVKRDVAESIRVRRTVETAEVDVDTEALREDVDVERVPVNRYVEETPQPRVENGVTIIPVIEEVVIVQKRLLLKEEVRIRKRRTVTKRKQRVPVRKERVAVERRPRRTT